jgi:tetratricopeptide (TPR) repeat protein
VTQTLDAAEGAIAVQIGGDNNVVNVQAGAAKLTLLRRHLAQAPLRSPRELLLTELRGTRLVGRTKELTTLQAWLETSSPIALHCLTGVAGSGKTRLAIELCERATGWDSGFVLHDELQRFASTVGLQGWRWQKPTLIVVDNAAAASSAMRHWLEILSERVAKPEDPKLRLLLLERDADPNTGWWGKLIQPGSLAGRGPDALADPAEPQTLPPFDAVIEQRALLREAMRAAAALQGGPVAASVPDPGQDLTLDAALAGAADAEPLFLIMAAIVAVQDGLPTALESGRAALAGRIAASEASRLADLGQSRSWPEGAAEHLAAAITLQGGCDRAAAMALIQAEWVAESLPPGAPSPNIAAILAEALPRQGGGVDALRPDLVGEAFLLLALRRDGRGPDEQAAIVVRAWKRAPATTASTVVRTAQDFADSAAHPSLAWLAALERAVTTPGEQLVLAWALPYHSQALAEPARRILDRLIGMLMAMSQKAPELRSDIAAWATLLADAYADLGQTHDALLALQRAVEWFRELAKTAPALQVRLARALTQMSDLLAKSGLPFEAYKAASEGVRILHSMLVGQPSLRAIMAEALTDLAARGIDLGDYKAAVTAAETAVGLCLDEAVGVTPENHAAALSNLAAAYDGADRSADALRVATDAVTLRRKQNARNPDLYGPGLAISLVNQAVATIKLGRGQDALQPAGESVRIYRRLAKLRPATFDRPLARALTNLSNMQDDVSDPAALETAQQAVDLLRPLAASDPASNQADYALALQTLALRALRARDADRALAAIAGAVAIYRALPAKLPPVLQERFGVSLRIQSDAHETNRQKPEAVADSAEALRVHMALQATAPQIFARQCGISLTGYLESCKWAGMTPDTALVEAAAAALRDMNIVVAIPGKDPK